MAYHLYAKPIKTSTAARELLDGLVLQHITANGPTQLPRIVDDVGRNLPVEMQQILADSKRRQGRDAVLVKMRFFDSSLQRLQRAGKISFRRGAGAGWHRNAVPL